MKKLTDESKPRKKPEKITDKARLDWLTRQNEHMSLDFDLCSRFKRGIGCSFIHQEIFYETPRKAIDAAIKAERDSRKGKG